MRDFLLGLWFVWQAVTSPFYPDPRVEIETARNWLSNNVKVGDRLTPQLLREVRKSGFQYMRVSSDVRRGILANAPWRTPAIKHLCLIEKSIASRPAISVTDVRALLAIDGKNRIVHRKIILLRTSL